MNNDPDNVIRLATDLRFVDQSKPYDEVRYLILVGLIWVADTMYSVGHTFIDLEMECRLSL